MELGDDEFIHIRDQLKEYEEGVTKNIVDSPQLVGIDKLSLKSFIETTLCEEIDAEIAVAGNCVIRPSKSASGYAEVISTTAEWNLTKLSFLGISSIGELEEKLIQFRPLLVPFVTNWLPLVEESPESFCDADGNPITDGDGDDDRGTFPPGIGLFYLSLVMLASTDDLGKMAEYWTTIGGYPEAEAEKTASQMQAAYASAVSHAAPTIAN